jgi:MFS family permease
MTDSAHHRFVSRDTYVVAVIGFLVAMIDGFDTLMLAFIAPLISREWTLPPQTVGTLFASSYAGAALGATLIGIAGRTNMAARGCCSFRSGLRVHLRCCAPGPRARSS